MAGDWCDVDRERLEEICSRFEIAVLEVFGSAARGQDRSNSDLDLPYELHPGAQLGWEIDDLAEELSSLFGRPVDLVSRRAVHPRLRDRILHDARPD